MFLFIRQFNLHFFTFKTIKSHYYSRVSTTMINNQVEQVINEGEATITTSGNVFYNPVQEFNRDLSISVLKTFSRIYAKEKEEKEKKTEHLDAVSFVAGKKSADGLTILEALSATGLRSIRYAKEIPGICSILANDISNEAVENIKHNIQLNQVDELVRANLSDATMLMYAYKKEFDAIDLDPYGSPSVFLDSAVQALKDGGLLLVTATDMAVLAGNSPETCYSKYGAVSLRMKACHEMALRILLQCIESHANRYGRYIVPQLSISVDFYVRVYVRVYTSPLKCKSTISKLSMVHHCTGCKSFELQPLGIVKHNDKNNGQVKFALPTSPFALTTCEHCKHPFHFGGPIWSAPIHNPDFVSQVLTNAPETLTTFKRIQGVLNVVLEELHDVPLYYTIERLSGCLHAETPPMLMLRSALLNAGYQVSYVHANKTAIKTNASGKVIWDIMRNWIKTHPVAAKWLQQDKVTGNILAQEPRAEYSFAMHADANPESRRLGYKRFQENPSKFWGPGSRATIMIGSEKSTKSKRNQGKRKRETESNKSTDSE